MTQSIDGKSDAIRELNDRFRCQGRGRGSVMVTYGVEAEGPVFVSKTVLAVRAFSSFDHQDDPHDEHDFGAFTVDGHELFFKIDYYDESLAHHSPDPACDAATHRVLTIVLRSEY